MSQKYSLKTFANGLIIPFSVALIFMVFSNIITVIGPDKIKDITNVISSGMMTEIDMPQLQSISGTLIVLYGLSAILGYLQGFLMTHVTQRFSQKLRSEIDRKINKLPLNYFDSHSQGDVLSRVTNDVDTFGQSLSQNLVTLLSSLILLIGTAYMMFTTNVSMTLVSIGSVTIGFVLVIVIMSTSQKYFVAQQQNLATANGYIEEIYSGHNIVYSYNAQQKVKETFTKYNQALYVSQWKSQFISGMMMPIMIFIGNFGYVLVCVYGALQVIDGNMTMGVIVAFMIYVNQFSRPLSQIAQSMTSLQQASAAMKRVFDILNEQELEDESHMTQRIQPVGQVTFDHVNFGYLPDQTIIKDFSVRVEAGQKVAIVGPTGAGKTTIVNLLMKFYKVNSGKIMIDGVNINDTTRNSVHDAFSMVLQDTWLFNGTVKENLIYNLQNISDNQVKEAAKTVGIHHFIKTLPKGYDTVLDDSTSISVGQKQLLTIARALLKNAPLLILDEATSSVDTRTEQLIQNAMDELMKGRTSFVIAHRLSTIRNADVILVMKDGNIIEKGDHDELMSQKEFYADLYNSQFTEDE